MKIYSLDSHILRRVGRIGLRREIAFKVRNIGFSIFVDTLKSHQAFKYMYICGISILNPNKMADYWGERRRRFKYQKETLEMFWKFLEETKKEKEQ